MSWFSDSVMLSGAMIENIKNSLICTYRLMKSQVFLTTLRCTHTGIRTTGKNRT